MYVIIAVGMLVFPCIFLLNLTPVVIELITALGFAVASLATLLLMLGYKCFLLMMGAELTPNMEIKIPQAHAKNLVFLQAKTNSIVKIIRGANSDAPIGIELPIAVTGLGLGVSTMLTVLTPLQYASGSFLVGSQQSLDDDFLVCVRQVAAWEFMKIEIRNKQDAASLNSKELAASSLASHVGVLDSSAHGLNGSGHVGGIANLHGGNNGGINGADGGINGANEFGFQSPIGVQQDSLLMSASQRPHAFTFGKNIGGDVGKDGKEESVIELEEKGKEKEGRAFELSGARLGQINEGDLIVPFVANV